MDYERKLFHVVAVNLLGMFLGADHAFLIALVFLNGCLYHRLCLYILKIVIIAKAFVERVHLSLTSISIDDR